MYKLKTNFRYTENEDPFAPKNSTFYKASAVYKLKKGDHICYKMEPTDFFTME